MSTATDETTKTDTTARSGYCKMFKVIMHNDPKTPMDFVTMILARYFEKELPAALKLMVQIHETGSGLAGVYPFEGAEFRVEQTHSIARTSGFPLSCSIEPA